MSDQKKGANAYKQNEVMTANKETVLLLLYAGAIRFIKQGMEAMEKKKISDKAKHLLRAHEIVTELRAGLNFNSGGGEIAMKLEQLYDFVTERIAQGNLTNTPKPLEEALSVLTTLNDGWEQAIASLKKEKASEEK